MCGIFGAVRLRGLFEPASFAPFVRLTDVVSYRGPDDSGYLAANGKEGRVLAGVVPNAPFDLFLGHRRLSIIDLSAAGHQPMTDGKGRWIVFNGEIFNYVELREELKHCGCEFATGTDTEVILKLYDIFGESAFDRLNGMWAIAIADLPARRVVLSRDRFSIKPLYVLAQDDEFYFASESKQLLPLVPKREPHLGVLSTFLAQGLLDHSQDTLFRGITRVPPKTNLTVSLQD